MTRHEKLSLGVSSAALIISILSPFFNYYLFQNEVRIRQLKSESFRVEGNAYDLPKLKTILFELRLKNTGTFPIERVRLLIQKRPDKPKINPDLPLDIAVEEKQTNIVVSLREPLPPHSDVLLGAFEYKGRPDDWYAFIPDADAAPAVWVTSEVSMFFLDWSFPGEDCSTVKMLKTELSMP
jgi:hypothetical protein